jgi:hypothetical protein
VILTSVISALMFRRSQRSGWMQKKVALYLLFKRCPKAVFGVLHRCGVSLSYEGALDALKETSKKVLDNLEDWKRKGFRLMAVADNINFTIVASEEISTNRSKIVNATIGFFTPLRIPNPVELSPENLEQQRLPTHLPDDFFFQSEAEFQKAKETVTILVGRVLAAHLPQMSKLKGIVTKPLTHDHSLHTKKATMEQGTEILFLNENKSSDIPAILDYFSVITSNPIQSNPNTNTNANTNTNNKILNILF